MQAEWYTEIEINLFLENNTEPINVSRDKFPRSNVTADGMQVINPILYPQPVFIIDFCDENDVPNAMDVAWCGISESRGNSMCLSAGYKTLKNIVRYGMILIKQFTIYRRYLLRSLMNCFICGLKIY